MVSRVTFLLSFILGSSLMGSLPLAVQPAYAEINGKPKAVVELFTSQGCSSCPPADKVISELVAEGEVLALTMPVDYWDYLGWRDTLGKPEHSERQRAYAAGRSDRDVYTPQAVINGQVHVVGSRRESIDATIAKLQKASSDPSSSLPLEVRLTKTAEALTISVDGTEELGENTTIWLVFYDDVHTVDIERGENRGRQVEYHNVVREMRPIGMWKGKRTEMILPLSELAKSGYDNCAVLVQSTINGNPGPILGAATLTGLSS
uniref:DUF1223 domain-containing protein n=1 Tax=Pararhizobium sp. IMCC3301 TaxID=3067904 RepID=UPI0027426169|nr:DUF1223 domain-containing protein [Pararhizobium sp. IMCC3301]